MSESGRNRRRSKRVEHEELLGYEDARRDGLYHLLGTGRTLDVSETGLRATMTEPLPLGKVLTFRLKLGDSLEKFKGRVVWCAELEADRRYEAGVRFHEVEFSLAKRLWEVLGGGATEQIQLSSDSADPEDPNVDSQQVSIAAFSPLTNKPLDPADASRQLARHLTGGSSDANLVRELVQDAVKRRPDGTPLEIRDDVARAADAMPKSAGPVPTPARHRRTPPPPPGGLADTFEADGLIQLVQEIGGNGWTGVLEVRSSVRSGHIAFREGRIAAVRTSDDKKGKKAIFALLEVERGEMHFRPDLLAKLVAEHDVPVEAVILELARRRDGRGS